MFSKNLLWFIVVILALLSLGESGVSFYKPKKGANSDDPVLKAVDMVDKLFNMAIDSSGYRVIYERALLGFPEDKLKKLSRSKTEIGKIKSKLAKIEMDSMKFKYDALATLLNK